jgi:hypothetical protein
LQSNDFTEYQLIRQQYVHDNVTVIQRIDGFDECWEWPELDMNGYGTSVGGRTRDGSWNKAYRTSYLAFVGPIPRRYQVDHLCRNRACVRPSHLEAVTQRVNIQRAIEPNRLAGTGSWNKLEVCTKGLHAMTDDNTYMQNVRGYQKRFCAQCTKDRMRKYRQADPERFARYEATRRAKQKARKLAGI